MSQTESDTLSQKNKNFKEDYYKYEEITKKKLGAQLFQGLP